MDKQTIIEQVMKPLLNAGFKAYFVGGCVRDSVMRKIPHDYDIVTNATPEQIHTVFDKFVDINSEAFGITVINVQSENVEIATFRKDRECDGRHTDVTYATSIEEDAVRRDLTINALYEDIDGNILDPTGSGIADIKNKIIRFVGNTVDRCREDNLRILRAYRFMFTFDFELDEQTALDMKNLLKEDSFAESFKQRVSGERIGKEMRKLFDAEKVSVNKLRTMIKNTEKLEIFPKELYQLVDQPVHTGYHKSSDNFEHTMSTFERVSEQQDFVMRFAVLFHDLGKAVVQQPSGKAPMHEVHSGRIARMFLHDRYKFTNKEVDQIAVVVENHMAMHQLHEHKRLYKIWKYLSQFDAGTLNRLKTMLYADCADSTLDISDQSITKFESINHLDYMMTTPYPRVFTGRDFMDQGLKGPQVGVALEFANDEAARVALSLLFDSYDDTKILKKDSTIKSAVHAARQKIHI